MNKELILRFLFPERIKTINNSGIITNYQIIYWSEIISFNWNDYKKKKINIGMKIKVINNFPIGFDIWKQIILI